MVALQGVQHGTRLPQGTRASPFVVHHSIELNVYTCKKYLALIYIDIGKIHHVFKNIAES